MTTTSLIRLAGMAAVLGGALRLVASFLPFSPNVALELLYLTVDLLLLLALLGVYAYLYDTAGGWGLAGFLLAVAGIAVIVGPDGSIGAVPMYPVGSLAISVGLCLLAAGSWRSHRLPRGVPLLWVAAAGLGVGGFLFETPALVVVAGVAFGLAFITAGLRMVTLP